MQDLTELERATYRADAAEYFLALALRHVMAEAKRLPVDDPPSELELIVKACGALNGLSEGEGREFYIANHQDDPAGFDEETTRRFPIYEDMAHRMMKFLSGSTKTLWPQQVQ
ncbi:hypothetical protein [Rhizobium sp. SYY.PMSO]|uniref:hypothetical protein n=1 Tax=Rhizobium sp. SYY.PMSO TaxID=3382192 RepID=UPI00398FA9B3